MKFARHVCKHTSCAWQVLQFSALVDLFDWPKLLCHRDLAVKDGCTSTAHWLQWFPPQLGADALGIGVSQLSYPNGVHMVFCAQANAGIDPGISPVPLVLPVLLSRLVWSLKLSLMTKVYVTSRISGPGMSFWWYLKHFEAMLYDLYAFSTMWSSLHFKHLQHIQAPSVWLGKDSWGLYSGHQWRFHGATAHSAADTSGALTLCSSWFVWSVWSDWPSA